ncbi:zinc ribbon domain-containing protein [Streptomyces sp. 796.1]|uniref:zinc ribbon domain-containing protein n=1 Tax=Streptomyces sp. 796.1 TaxID=3163029 RepID=UPI0039C94553
MDRLQEDRPHPLGRRRHLRPGPSHPSLPRPHLQHRTHNPYLFRGRITCALCTRRMQGQWSHGEAYYRCRFPEEYALANHVQHPRNIYKTGSSPRWTPR